MKGHPPVSLVTGGSSGIGLATARLLRQRGHRLALVARRQGPLMDAKNALAADDPEAVLTIEADIGDPAWEGAIVHAVLERFGRLDAIVHAAGQAPSATIEGTTPDLLRACFQANTLGFIELVRRAWPVFQKQHETADRVLEPGPCLVAISSYASADPFPGFLAYAGAKGALNVMMRVLAQEGEPIGLRAYSIAPGAVETPMLRGLFSADELPASACLDPADVARLVLACLEGAHDRPSGSTTFIKRTDEGVRVTDAPA